MVKAVSAKYRHALTRGIVHAHIEAILVIGTRSRTDEVIQAIQAAAECARSGRGRRRERRQHIQRCRRNYLPPSDRYRNQELVRYSVGRSRAARRRYAAEWTAEHI